MMTYESVTVDNTVGGVFLTRATYDRARNAFMTLESAQIRFTKDGTAPTTSVGHLLQVGQTLNLDGSNEIKNFRAIRTGAASGVLKVSYK